VTNLARLFALLFGRTLTPIIRSRILDWDPGTSRVRTSSGCGHVLGGHLNRVWRRRPLCDRLAVVPERRKRTWVDLATAVEDDFRLRSGSRVMNRVAIPWSHAVRGLLAKQIQHVLRLLRACDRDQIAGRLTRRLPTSGASCGHPADRPQRRHRLRRAERQIDPRDAGPVTTDRPARRPRIWVTTVHQRHQRVPLDHGVRRETGRLQRLQRLRRACQRPASASASPPT
jgi:hypothetical protein